MGLLAGAPAGGVGSLLRMIIICSRYVDKARRCNADRAGPIGSVILIYQYLRPVWRVVLIANISTVIGRDRQWV